MKKKSKMAVPILACPSALDHAMPSNDAATLDTSEIAPAIKKQKTSRPDAASGIKKKIAAPASVKSVKAIDPAIIEQRRETVRARILKLESRLDSDRALLAKYSVPDLVKTEDKEKESSEDDGPGADTTENE